MRIYSYTLNHKSKLGLDSVVALHGTVLNGSVVIYSTAFPYVFPSLHPYIVLALGVEELLLVSVFQHFLHHSTANPHVKHSLSVLVSHLLHYTNAHMSILFSLLMDKIIKKIPHNALWEFVRYLLLKLTAISSNLPNSSVPYLSIGGLIYSQ